MLSIGEMAHLTGVSRRMLRHWEETGLIAPASVDPGNGYRRYERAQVGRVRAVSTLRSVGFGLTEIRHLLDHAQLTEDRLVTLLGSRERELVAQLEETSTRLTEVRGRLDAIRRGHHTIMSTLHLAALPPLRLWSLQATVSDESEISAAVADLLPRLRSGLDGHDLSDGETVLTYDGRSEHEVVVTVGVAATDAPSTPDLRTVEVSGCDRGVSVEFDVPPPDVGDAWISLDARLESHDLETTGTYRQVLRRDGGVLLQAPVRARPAP